MLVYLVAFALAALALYLRLRVFIGTRPGGVDTWYYLASAEALREQRHLPIRLPQYLLHDPQESYPAVFPIFLALLPQRWLRRYFWLLSPLIDALHLLLLYALAYRLTEDLAAAAIAGLIYAVTPQLISETRNLNGRAFASLLQTLAMVTLLRSAIPSLGPTAQFAGPDSPFFLIVALVLAALLYNTHTSTTIAYLVSTAVMSVAMHNPRFVLVGVGALPLAVVLSGGYYLRVIGNHLDAARFWRRNVHLTRAHQVADSPVLHVRNEGAPGTQNGGLYGSAWRTRLSLGVRVLGENPFILAMLVTPVPATIWAEHMYWWAVAILAWSLLTTFGGPLRILGPGFHYMKASVFPSAYVLAVAVSIQASPLVRGVLLVSFLGSFGALAYFYRVMAKRSTEHTAQTPPELAAAADALRQLPGTNVLVLPTMYADYVAYNARKAVVWGGHSGNLDKLEEFFPVIRKPLQYFFQRYAVDYFLLDTAYADPGRLGIDGATSPLECFGSLELFQVQADCREQPALSLSAAEGHTIG